MVQRSSYWGPGIGPIDRVLAQIAEDDRKRAARVKERDLLRREKRKPRTARARDLAQQIAVARLADAKQVTDGEVKVLVEKALDHAVLLDHYLSMDEGRGRLVLS